MEQLGDALVPYSLLLVMPLMPRMSDSAPATRNSATSAFARLVALLPLAQAWQLLSMPVTLKCGLLPRFGPCPA